MQNIVFANLFLYVFLYKILIKYILISDLTFNIHIDESTP